MFDVESFIAILKSEKTRMVIFKECESNEDVQFELKEDGSIEFLLKDASLEMTKEELEKIKIEDSKDVLSLKDGYMMIVETVEKVHF